MSYKGVLPQSDILSLLDILDGCSKHKTVGLLFQGRPPGMSKNLSYFVEIRLLWTILRVPSRGKVVQNFAVIIIKSY